MAEEFFNYLVYQVIHKPIDTPDKPKISISVIIPCRNEENHSGSCIDGIYTGALNGLEIEVLLIDGMSTDKTLDIVSQMQLKYPSLRVIANRLQVTPIAFNIGIKEAKGDFIQIVGARQIISPNYLLEAKRILTEMKDIWCVGGLVQNIYQNHESEVIGLAMASPFGVGGKNFRVLKKSDYTDTVGTPMYPRWVFKKIGFFNEALVRNQDDELNYRVSSSGGKIFLNADIQIKYYVRAKISNLFKQYYQYGYWKVFVNQMHSTITSTRQLVPLFLF
ncbi:MAG: glycosyltransferase family 2 protein [Crocinitomicaceae bacterium]|nr:glycosyltransferase family 2 protein [Crocinitomicaceae bacterium]